MNYWRKLPQNPLLLDFIFLLIVTCVILLLNLGNRPLAIWDEGLYCGTTQDMKFHSQWLFPTVDGEFSVRYGKPPLINWLQGISTTIFGWDKFSLRLPTAIGMVLQILLVWLSGILVGGRWVGLVAACLLLISRNYVGMGRIIWQENLIAPFFTASLLCYGRTFFNSTRFPISGTILSAIFCSMAVLTKQSFGLLAPMALVACEIFESKPGKIKRILLFGSVFVLGFIWWFIYTAYVVGEISWQSWFGYHLYQRITEGVEGHQSDPSSFALSLQNLMDGTPWTIGILGWVFLAKITPTKTEASALIYRWSALLIIEYIVVGIVASKTFLSWYQLVVTPPIAIGSAYIIVESFKFKQLPWVRWIVPLLIITNRLIAVKKDAFLGIVISLFLIFIYEMYQSKIQRKLQPFLASVIVLVAGLWAINSIDINSQRDLRAKIANSLVNQEKVLVFADNPQWRIWKCYLPHASVFSSIGPVPCDRINNNITDAKYVLVEGKGSQCPLKGFKKIQQNDRLTVWKKIDISSHQ